MDNRLNFLQEVDALDGPEVGSDVVSFNQPKRPSKIKRHLLILFFAGFLAVCLVLLINIGRFVNSIIVIEDSFQQVQTHVLDLEFEKAHDEIIVMQDSLKDAKSSLWIVGWMKPLPLIGDQVDALYILIDSGLALTNATGDTLAIVRNVYSSISDIQKSLDEIAGVDKEYTFGTLPSDVRVKVLQAFKNITPDLVQVEAELRIAQSKLSTINDRELIGGAEDIISKVQDSLLEILPIIELITPFAQSIDELAGVGSDRQWLLLFLNNTEMRPGGGFMGVYGLLQVRDGEILDIKTADTYSIDKLVEDDGYIAEPPFPISEYLGLDTWYFRDANWYPDFAESSKTAVQLLRQEYSYSSQPVPEVHGVIGFTPTVIEGLLEIVGDIEVNGIIFNSENLTEALEYEVEYGFKDRGVEWDDRKVIINDLADILMDRLMSMSFSDMPHLIEVFIDMIEEKQIGVYSFNADTQVVFEDAGWAGVLENDNADDILMVIDANMGALKTDHAIEKNIKYSIIPTVDGYQAQVDIKYLHNGDFDWRTSRYQTYTSILVPMGSELISTNGASSSSVEEFGMMRFGGYISIEPGKEKTLTFVYKLPDTIVNAVDSGLYELVAFKQMGSKQASLTLDLDFDKNLRAAMPSEQEDQYGDRIYHIDTSLRQDLKFIVQF